MESPLISIVVPSFNQGRYIEQTLASIAGQNWPRVETIVIDGGSTDETAEVVARFRPGVTHFISEPDRGQADAINKGFRLARGEVLAWLNSDDFYLPCTFDRAVRALGDVTQPRLATGGVFWMFEGKNEARAYLPWPFDPVALRARDRMFQPATFWTRALWEKTGELNPEHHFVLDWDFFLRAAEHCEFTPIPDFLAVYRFHAQHKSSSGDQRRTQEIIELVERYAGPEWGAAYRDVAGEFDRLTGTLSRLRKLHLYPLRRVLFRGLYRKHGAKVKVALAQLTV